MPTDRADLIIRTEMAFAYNAALLAELRDQGVLHVRWICRMDNSCEDCVERHKNIYPLDDVIGDLPMHPRCRCTVVPVD